MKKIIGILVALGLVLSLGVMATPVAADVTTADVVVTLTRCEFDDASYNITFNTTASLTEGVHCVCIDFPAGTSFVGTFPEDGDIVINGDDVFADEVTIDGTEVCFLVPAHYNAGPTWVFFDDVVVNPAAGTYTLDVYTCRAPDSTPVASNPYVILPAVAEYEFTVDFSPTYPGLPVGFVPPMKACGQNDTAYFNTVWNGTVWFDQFDLTFGTVEEENCAEPCDNVTLSVVLMDAPDGATVHLVINGTKINLDANNASAQIGGVLPLTTNMTIEWPSLIHVDSVGDYEICFYADCGDPPVCEPAGAETIVTFCIEFHAYQWKDAYQIDLNRKWNLISLPIVPFETDIATLLATYNASVSAPILDIWYYDRCSDDWATYPGGLTDMYDGKAYWIKVDYSHTVAAKAPGLPAGGFWMWGTAVPMPPDAPSAYDVCEGWNMVGYRALVDDDNDAYLWNLVGDYGPIYGWDSTLQVWDAPITATGVDLVVTKGYWIPFAVDGTIYP